MKRKVSEKFSIYQRVKRPEIRFLSSTMIESAIENIGGIGGLIGTSFLIFSGFSEEQIASIVAVVGLAQLFQIFSTMIYRYSKNRKKTMFRLRFIRSLALVFLPFTAIYFSESKLFAMIIILTLVRYISVNLIGGGFVEWNDSYVEENKKGSYYGTRNVLVNLVFMILSFIIGKVLDHFTSTTALFIGIYLFCFMLNVMEWQILHKIPIRDNQRVQSSTLSKTMLAPLKDRNFVFYLIFTIVWSMSLSLGKPLMNVYVIKHLQFSYSLIAITGSLTAFIKLFSGIYQGKKIDIHGAKKVVIINGLGYGLTTFIFVFMSPNLPQIYIMASILNGIFMIGFNVSKFRLEMQLSKGTNMNAYISMNFFFSGLSVFVGTSMSGVLIRKMGDVGYILGSVTINSYQVLFLISGLLHVIAMIYFMKYTRDNEAYEK